MVVEDFNAEQWAGDHEKLCGQRFGEIKRDVSSIMKILTTAGMILVGVAGWSLKTQYEAQQRQIEQAQASASRAETILQAVQQVQGQVAEQVVPKLEKVR